MSHAYAHICCVTRTGYMGERVVCAPVLARGQPWCCTHRWGQGSRQERMAQRCPALTLTGYVVSCVQRNCVLERHSPAAEPDQRREAAVPAPPGRRRQNSEMCV